MVGMGSRQRSKWTRHWSRLKSGRHCAEVLIDDSWNWTARRKQLVSGSQCLSSSLAVKTGFKVSLFCRLSTDILCRTCITNRPHGLTFTRWGCYSLCLWHKLTELASVFMALSTVFPSINSPDNSTFSNSALPVLSLSYWSFHLYISSWKSLVPWYNP